MSRLIGAVLLLAGIALPASAQSRERGADKVPASHRPPPGMCRIWIDGVPPGQQPEPTDCATAVRERPAASRVIFGDRRGEDDAVRNDPRVKGFTKSKESRDDRRDDRDDERCPQDDDECDDELVSRRPGAWPRMLAAIDAARGTRTADTRRWLGDRVMTVRYEDRDRNGRPERASWYDRSGQLVQEWIDADRDGVADVVRLYRGGKLVRVYEK
jgi:hypothetical protein